MIYEFVHNFADMQHAFNCGYAKGRKDREREMSAMIAAIVLSAGGQVLVSRSAIMDSSFSTITQEDVLESGGIKISATVERGR